MPTKLMVGLILCVVLFGCQHGQQSSVQEDIIRALNIGESGLLMALTIAEVMGADHEIIERTRAATSEAFAAAHKLVSIQMNQWDKQELLAATDALESATANVINVCRIAGVSQPILSIAEDTAIQAYAMIRDVLGSLPKRTSFFRPNRFCRCPAMESLA